MHDVKVMTTNLDAYSANLARRGVVFDADFFTALVASRRELQQHTEHLQAERNRLSKQVGQQMRSAGDDQTNTDALVADLQAQVKQIHAQLEQYKTDLQQAQQAVVDLLAVVPNQLDSSVPDGADESHNQIIKQYGSVPQLSTPRDHVTLAEAVDGIDFDAASRIAGARFALLKNDIARLHRALAHWMMDEHIERGYTEYTVPQLVHQHCLYGTGQLPKFADDIFFTQDEQHALIPTSEVVLANIAREQIVPRANLPCKYVTVSACFRKEAGSYGKDTHGLMRQHQFDKVELVQLVEVGSGLDALDDLTHDAEHILQSLGLPYQVVLLCAGDTGFSAKKTFDLEVWVPSQQRYREISSCSWCGDFQARRMKARYKDANGQMQHLETLNGSGVAVGRALLAVLENYQQADGSIVIPHRLRSYFGGRDCLTPSC